MGFGSNFFGAATAALPQGVQLGIQGVALKRQKRQDQLREEKDTMDLFLKQWKTAENDPLLQDTMLEDFTIKHGTEEGNLQSFARTFQGMGADKRKMYIDNNKIINDAIAGKGATTKAQGLAANNANKAIIRSLGRVVPTDMRHIDKQLGGSDAALTRREAREDADRRFKFYENQSKVLEKQVEETKLLLEKSDNQEGRDFLETSIGRLKSLLQNMYANGMGFDNEFIDSKFEILGIGADYKAKNISAEAKYKLIEFNKKRKKDGEYWLNLKDITKDGTLNNIERLSQRIEEGYSLFIDSAFAKKGSIGRNMLEAAILSDTKLFESLNVRADSFVLNEKDRVAIEGKKEDINFVKQKIKSEVVDRKFTKKQIKTEEKKWAALDADMTSRLQDIYQKGVSFPLEQKELKEKIELIKDKRANLINNPDDLRKAMTNASSAATTIANLMNKDEKALDIFSDFHGIDKKDLDFKSAIAFAKELLVFEIKQIEIASGGEQFPLKFNRDIFPEEEFNLYFGKKVK